MRSPPVHSQPSAVPPSLRSGLAALAFALAAGGGAYFYADREAADLIRHPYIQAAAQDGGTSRAVKLAMVMAAYYESSWQHKGAPYVDRNGRGQPLTVCNGLTGQGVEAGRRYTPANCYQLERARYLRYEAWLRTQLPGWHSYTDMTRAVLLDFVHNKGEGNFLGSTMRRKLLAGDVLGACRENVRWNRGTVDGVSVMLPGLVTRGNSNAELCTFEDPQP